MTGLHKWKYRGLTSRCKAPIILKNRKARLAIARYLANFLKSLLSSGVRYLPKEKTRSTGFRAMGQGKCGERDSSWSKVTHIVCPLSHTCYWRQHCRMGLYVCQLNHWCLLMMWLLTRSSRISMGLYSLFRFSQVLQKWKEVQMDNDPKHTVKATQEFLRVKKLDILDWVTGSPDLKPKAYASPISLSN